MQSATKDNNKRQCLTPLSLSQPNTSEADAVMSSTAEATLTDSEIDSKAATAD